MNKLLMQYIFEPTKLSKVRRFRFAEEFGILTATIVLLSLICLVSLYPRLNINSIIVVIAVLIMVISLIAGTYGFFGLLIWRRHIRRMVEAKNK